MRDIFKVLEQIKNLSKNEEYIKKVEKIEYSLRWKAPEDMWDYVYDVFIIDYIPPKTDLDYKVLSIWTTKSVEDLKEQIDRERIKK